MIYDPPTTLSGVPQPIAEVVFSPSPDKEKPKITGSRILLRQFLAALLLGSIVISSRFWWPRGYEAAKKHLVCQELGPIQTAGCTFVGQVLDGESVPDALAAFCTTVYEGILYNDEAAS